MNPQGLISLLDISKRKGTDAATGLVEEVVTFAPEVEIIMGRAIPGTYYTARIRPLLTSGGGFRKANQGVGTGASVYDQRRFDCMAFDSQLQIDEMVLMAAEQEGDSLALLQAEEAEGAIRDKAIYLGKQVWQGLANDPNGFPGAIDFLDTFSTVIDQRTNAPIDLVVDAGGSGAACEIAWFLHVNHPQGFGFLWGGNQGIDIKPWVWQYIQDANDPTKRLRASVSNLSGFIGSTCANPFSIGCVKNIDNTLTNDAEAHPLTDKLIADLEAKFPVGWGPNICFISRATRRGLQKQRAVTLFAQADKATADNNGGAGLIAPLPTYTASGYPIKVTDSIQLGTNF